MSKQWPAPDPSDTSVEQPLDVSERRGEDETWYVELVTGTQVRLRPWLGYVGIVWDAKDAQQVRSYDWGYSALVRRVAVGEPLDLECMSPWSDGVVVPTSVVERIWAGPPGDE